jgi:hypothetical protein
MTIENWLMIAVIMATLIAPVLAELVKPRINQPQPAPAPNQPKNLIQRIGGVFIYILESSWVMPVFIMIIYSHAIYRDLGKTAPYAPMDRKAVLELAVDTGGVWYGVVVLMLNIRDRITHRVMNLSLETARISGSAIQLLMEVEKLVGGVVALQQELNTTIRAVLSSPEKGPLGKLRDKLKRLFSD